MRLQTEWYRKHRNTLLKDGKGLTMGALYWQLNDVWPAPTWSSIGNSYNILTLSRKRSKLFKYIRIFPDYDQRWKMLHYSTLDFFAPIIVVPEIISYNLTIYLVSDILRDLEVILYIDIYSWESNIPLQTTTDTIILVSIL